MYTGKSEFKDKFFALHLVVEMRSVDAGSFTYTGSTHDGKRVKVISSMNSLETTNYFHSETVKELLDSDVVSVYVNEECILKVE